jgi:hypothetical protein
VTGFATSQSNYVYTCGGGTVADGRAGLQAYLLLTTAGAAGLTAQAALSLALAAPVGAAPGRTSASNLLAVAGLASGVAWTGAAGGWSNLGPGMSGLVYPNLVATDAAGNSTLVSPPVAVVASRSTYFWRQQANVAGMYFWDKMMGPQWSATLTDGSVAVVWSGRATSAGQYAVYLQLCAGGTGANPGAPLLLADLELAGDAGEDMLPCVLALAGRRLAVVWQARGSSANGTYYDYVNYNTFAVSGTATAPVVTADSAAARTYGLSGAVSGRKLLLAAHALPTTSGQAFAITWSEFQTDVSYSYRNTAYYGGRGTYKGSRGTSYNQAVSYHRDVQMLTADSVGSPVGLYAVAQVNTGSTNDEEVGAYQRGASLASGHHVVVWENSNTLYYKVYDAAHNVVLDSTVFATVTGAAADANPFPNVSQGLAAANSFLVTWSQNTFNDGADAIVYGMELSVTGATMRAPATLAVIPGDTVVPATAFSANGAHYVFMPSVGTSGATRLTRVKTNMAGAPSVAYIELADVAYASGAPMTVTPLPAGGAAGLPPAAALLTYLRTVSSAAAPDYQVEITARLIDADTML